MTARSKTDNTELTYLYPTNQSLRKAESYWRKENFHQQIVLEKLTIQTQRKWDKSSLTICKTQFILCEMLKPVTQNNGVTERKHRKNAAWHWLLQSYSGYDFNCRGSQGKASVQMGLHQAPKLPLHSKGDTRMPPAEWEKILAMYLTRDWSPG